MSNISNVSHLHCPIAPSPFETIAPTADPGIDAPSLVSDINIGSTAPSLVSDFNIGPTAPLLVSDINIGSTAPSLVSDYNIGPTALAESYEFSDDDDDVF